MGVRVAFLDPEASSSSAAAVLIPLAALQGSAPTNWVWVVTDGRAQKRTVNSLPDEADPATVQTGLHAGESVIVQAPPNLRPGMKVREQQP